MVYVVSSVHRFGIAAVASSRWDLYSGGEFLAKPLGINSRYKYNSVRVLLFDLCFVFSSADISRLIARGLSFCSDRTLEFADWWLYACLHGRVHVRFFLLQWTVCLQLRVCNCFQFVRSENSHVEVVLHFGVALCSRRNPSSPSCCLRWFSFSTIIRS